MKIVRNELLESLAKNAPDHSDNRQRNRTHTAIGLQKWIDDHHLQVEGPTNWNGGRRWIFPVCPWNGEHQNRSAYVVQFSNGATAAGCHHNGCCGKDWHALRDIVEPGWRSDQQLKATTHAAPEHTMWTPPVPFHHFDLPPFPVAVFPDWLQAFVQAEAIATQTPVDLAGMLALSVLAAACAKKVVVCIKDGYCEPVNIFTITALPSGSRKTAVFAAMIKPLEDYEQSETKRTAGDIAHRRTAYKIKEATLRRLQEQAASDAGKNREKLIHEAGAVAAELSQTLLPAPMRFIADDCTPEKLPGLLRDNGGRIAVMSPEGDVFDLMAGRYSQNKTGNFGVYLKGHAGDTLRVDRVGRSPEFVHAPALTMGLAVQPEVIRGLAETPGFRGRGLLARFLYALPASSLGRRDTNPHPLPDDVRATYHEKVLALLNLSFREDANGEPCAHILTLYPGARKSLQSFEAWVEPQLSEFGDLGCMSDWGGKIVGAVGRIAGLLHMAEFAGTDSPWDTPISLATIEGAIRIGKYLIPHAQAAFAEMGADEAVEKARRILRWIRHEELVCFTRRDLHQAMRSAFRRAGDLESPLALLASHDFIRMRPEDSNAGPGRPQSPTYDVNPIWLSQQSENSPWRSDEAFHRF